MGFPLFLFLLKKILDNFQNNCYIIGKIETKRRNKMKKIMIIVVFIFAMFLIGTDFIEEGVTHIYDKWERDGIMGTTVMGISISINNDRVLNKKVLEMLRFLEEEEMRKVRKQNE